MSRNCQLFISLWCKYVLLYASQIVKTVDICFWTKQKFRMNIFVKRLSDISFLFFCKLQDCQLFIVTWMWPEYCAAINVIVTWRRAPIWMENRASFNMLGRKAVRIFVVRFIYCICCDLDARQVDCHWALTHHDGNLSVLCAVQH